MGNKMFSRVFLISLIMFFLLFIIFLFLFLYGVADIKDFKSHSSDCFSGTFDDIQIKGDFYDRNGKPLTRNAQKCKVLIDRRKEVFLKYHEENMKKKCPISKERAINLVSETIGVDAAVIKQRMAESKEDLAVVANDLDISCYNRIRRLNYSGIVAEKIAGREYYEGCLAGNLLGSLDGSGNPLSGFEIQFAEYIQGKPGKYLTKRDKFGREDFGEKIPDYEWKTDKNGNFVYKETEGEKKKVKDYTKPMIRKDGYNVILTIDSYIQRIAEKALYEMCEKEKPDYAVCIVMDSKTSEVLAMANYPAYDNVNKKGLCNNYAVTMPTNPGSTFKAFTVAMAIDKGADPQKSFGTCKNYDTEGVFGGLSPLKCDHGPHGACTPANIIEKSCNIGAAYIGRYYGMDEVDKYFRKFGLYDGSPMFANAGNKGGYLMSLKDFKKQKRNCANACFGQSVQSTCLAVTNGYCVIANGGIYNSPKILKEVRTQGGTKVKIKKEDYEKRDGERVISEEAAKTMAKLLEGCVTGDHGTGKPAKVDNVNCAGKTGSAQTFENGHIKLGDYFVSFVGFAPTEDPQLVIGVFARYPKVTTYGATVAAPVWKKVMENSLGYWKLHNE